MNQGTWGLPLRRPADSDPGTSAGERRDPWPASTFGRGAVLVVGALGVMLAFAGSAAAGGLITGKDIKDGTITSVDLRDGRLQGLDIRDRSLTRTDFGGLQAGVVGSPGPTGPIGAAGAHGVSRPKVTIDLIAFGQTGIDVECPVGTHVVGGGVIDAELSLKIETSHPTSTGWSVAVLNDVGARTSVTAMAVCVQ